MPPDLCCHIALLGHYELKLNTLLKEAVLAWHTYMAFVPTWKLIVLDHFYFRVISARYCHNSFLSKSSVSNVRRVEHMVLKRGPGNKVQGHGNHKKGQKTRYRFSVVWSHCFKHIEAWTKYLSRLEWRHASYTLCQVLFSYKLNSRRLQLERGSLTCPWPLGKGIVIW